MARRNALLPAHGNPMRPVLVLLVAFFGLLLVAFPVIMSLAGVGTGGTVGVTLLIVVVALICFAVLRTMAGAYGGDRVGLLAGEAVAQWWLAADEHQRFLGQERRRTRR